MSRGQRRSKDRPRTRGPSGGAIHLGDGEPVCGAVLSDTADLTVRVVADVALVTCRACIAIHEGDFVVGEHCTCAGEAETVFVIVQVEPHRSYLRRADGQPGYKGMGHGWESNGNLRHVHDEPAGHNGDLTDGQLPESQ